MTNKISYSFFIICLLLVSKASFAGIMFEPYLGAHIGSYQESNQDSTTTKGIGIGARGAFVWNGIFAGGDLQFSALKASSDPKADIEQNQFGLLGGFAFPVIPIRTWMVYNIYDKAGVTPGGSLRSGSGYKFGVSFEPLPILSFNFEYKESSYSELQSGGKKTKLNPSTKVTSIMFSISFLFYADL